MRISLSALLRIIFLLLLFIGVESACAIFAGKNFENPSVNFLSSSPNGNAEYLSQDSIQIKVGTFLGNSSRNYYGDSIGDKLDVLWKTFLGKGTTIVTAEKGIEEWFGAGWTGQPLVVKEKNKTYLIQGAFDHHLKKIDAATGELIWNYEYDDILKGTGTIWKNDSAKNPLDRIVIMQGSRKGVQNSMASPNVSSFRAVSFFTGKELWRMNVCQTDCYSRDVDASALLQNDTAYIGLENGTFVKFDPGKNVVNEDTINRPVIFSETMLYSKEDHAHHGGNLVTESSPARIGNHIYITAGSGHVFGYNISIGKIDWDFFIGSDLDGSPVVTADSCILVEVEKQYIAGHGGVFKLNPACSPEKCVEWFCPTGDFNFSDWEGGVIGSVAVNDSYNDGTFPHFAAFTGIDGNLLVVDYNKVKIDSMVVGPDGKTLYPTPVVNFKLHIGPSISTPIFSKNKLIAAGYNGINLFTFDTLGEFKLKDNWQGNFEASPVADEGRIYIASRDGFLYCFGDSTFPGLHQSETTNSNKIPIKQEVTHVNRVANNSKLISQLKNGFPYLLSVKNSGLPNKLPIEERNLAFLLVKYADVFESVAVDSVEAVAIIPEKETVSIPEVIPEKQNLETTSEIGFHLIAGVFKSKENADRNLKLWKERGMNAILFVTPSGMNYISVAHGKSATDLETVKQNIKSNFGVDAWVFEKK